MTVDELLIDDQLESLVEAEARGVDIQPGGISPAVQERIQNRVPSASIFETLWEWSELGAGRVLIIDERTALASVLVDDERRDGPNETAIWGSRPHNSLVVILRGFLTSRLGDH